VDEEVAATGASVGPDVAIADRDDRRRSARRVGAEVGVEGLVLRSHRQPGLAAVAAAVATTRRYSAIAGSQSL